MRSASSEPKLVEPSDDLTRYLLTRGHFRSSDGTVKWQAFMPRKDNRSLSTYRTTGKKRERIIEIGKLVSEDANKTLYGHATVKAAVFLEHNLHLDPDDIPRKGHVNILAWPEKPEQMSIAQDLARNATSYLY